MKNSENEREILTFVGDIMRKFYTKNDFSPLLSHLAKNAIISTKFGASFSGADSIAQAFNDSVFIRCNINEEKLNISKIKEKIYLAEYTVSLIGVDFVEPWQIRATLVLQSDKQDVYKVNYISFAELSRGRIKNNLFPVEKRLPRRGNTIEREEILMNFLLEGLSNKEVAKRLALAEITVKKALSKIYQKFEVKNRYELLDKLNKSKNEIKK